MRCNERQWFGSRTKSTEAEGGEGARHAGDDGGDGGEEEERLRIRCVEVVVLRAEAAGQQEGGGWGRDV